MLKRYEEFLAEFDSVLSCIRECQKQYIKCKKGCSACCQRGEYPFSWIEFMYLTQGYIGLDANTKVLVQQNIQNILEDEKEYTGKNFEYQCPFLINGECCVYKYRGLVCRTYGICYYDDISGYVKLPDCVHQGLNYSDFYFEKTKTLTIKDVPKVNFRLDRIFKSELFEKYELEYGAIRPMIEWFSGRSDNK